MDPEQRAEQREFGLGHNVLASIHVIWSVSNVRIYLNCHFHFIAEILSYHLRTELGQNSTCTFRFLNAAITIPSSHLYPPCIALTSVGHF